MNPAWPDDLFAAIADGRYPLNGVFEPTLRCNLRCLHCYVAEGPHGREATAAEQARILEEAVAAGTLFLLYTGGEPFLRPDFPGLYARARRLGVLVTLFTNATLVTEAIADLLAEVPPTRVEVTLYGATPAPHDRFTRTPGSFEAALRGIDRMRTRGLEVVLKTVDTDLTRAEVPRLRALARDRGCAFRHDAEISAAVGGSRAPCIRRLPPARVVADEVAEPGKAASWRELGRLMVRGEGEPPPGPRLLECGAGRYAYHVDPRGRLCPCETLRHRAYDLGTGTFRDGFHRVLGAIRDLPHAPPARCRTCRISSFCSCCPGHAHLEHADEGAPVDYLCELAHRRAAAFVPDPGTLATVVPARFRDLLAPATTTGGTCAP